MIKRSNTPLSLSNPNLNNKSFGMSYHTIKINQKYSESFELLQKYSNKPIKLNMDHKLCPSIQGIKPKLDELIENLNEVNEKVFFNDYIELIEKKAASGFLKQHSTQFFKIDIKGKKIIKILVKARKGNVESYISFKNPKPTKNSCDKVYETEVIEIQSYNSTFIEQQCYLGVYGISNSSISVSFSFKNPVLDTKDFDYEKKSSKTIAKQHKYLQEIQELRKDPTLKIIFEQKIKSILDKRKKAEKLNCTRLNKVLVFNNSHDLIRKKDELDKKIENAKKKKNIISEEKLESLKMIVMRKKIRKLAEEKALEIQNIVFRKEYFEKNWIVLSIFVKAMLELKKRHQSKRNEKKFQIFIQMQAYKLQKNYKAMYPKSFLLSFRIKALAKNSLKLFNLCIKNYYKHTTNKKLVNCIKEIAFIQSIGPKLERLNTSSRVIQRSWKKYSKLNNKRFLELTKAWDTYLNDVYSQLGGKNRRKKKSQLFEKIISIPNNIKEKFLKNYLHQCKINFLKKNRQKAKKLEFQYRLDEENLKKLMISASEEASKQIIKSSQLSRTRSK
jgi:thiol-disulfide isomerase/thioredoxin